MVTVQHKDYIHFYHYSAVMQCLLQEVAQSNSSQIIKKLLNCTGRVKPKLRGK